jgi:hypothetical protein
MRIKKGLWFVLAIVVGGAAVAGGAAAYTWQRVTAVPTWYASSTTNSDLATHLSSGSRLLPTKLATGEGVTYLGDRQVEITLTAAELNTVIQEELSQTPQSTALSQVTQGIKATIENDQLQAGVVVNPAEFPIQELPAEAQVAFQQALETMPMWDDREWYIGIVGRPSLENGQLRLSDDTHLQVGNMRLSLAEVARLTNLDPDQLNAQINLVLPATGLTLQDIEVVDGQVILRGTTE